jgi:arylsulfatase A-like enzyme
VDNPRSRLLFVAPPRPLVLTLVAVMLNACASDPVPTPTPSVPPTDSGPPASGVTTSPSGVPATAATTPEPAQPDIVVLMLDDYTRHHGVVDNDPRPFRPEMTIATQLRTVGYHTIIVGKYMNHMELLPVLTPAYNEADMSDKPAWMRDLSLLPYADGWPLAPACRALLSVDEMFAAVHDVLAARGRLDDTLFVLTADNGMAWGDHRLAGKQVPYANHLPLWIRWDARVNGGPMTPSGHTQLTDLAPTFCAIAGCRLGPFPTGQTSPDGISILDFVEGASPRSGPHCSRSMRR